MGRLAGASMGRLAGAERGGGGSSALDLTSGGTIGGNVTLNGHLSMGAGKVVKIDDGTVGAPGLAFLSDLDNGLYRIGANEWALSAGGVAVQSMTATLQKALVAIGLADGTVGAPALAFAADLDNGLYRIGANDWALAAGGVAIQEMTATLQKALVALGVSDGTAGAPGLAFTSDLDCGLYRVGANDIAMAAGGVAVQEYIATAVKLLLNVVPTGPTQVITAVTDTIQNTSYLLRLNNTAGASRTLTSTPSISVTGVTDGQLLILENIGADNVVLQDESVLPGSKLRCTGGTNKSITPRDTIGFVYASATGEWNNLWSLTAL